MRVEHNDENTEEFTDQAGMSWMLLLVNRINDALVSEGVSERQVRHEICTKVLFGLAYELDAGWFVEGDRKIFPKVCFAERADPTEDQNLGDITCVHIPTDVSSWHEYAVSVVSEYFYDNDEKVSDIRTGSYDRED